MFESSPFESLEGVGALVRAATEAGRRVNPTFHVGVSGEHGGDPRSVHFFDEVGLDDVSCSPFRIPVARLEPGRSALAAAESLARHDLEPALVAGPLPATTLQPERHARHG